MQAADGQRQYDQRMDLTSKLLRDVEFRDRLRGYDTDEVDEFLERVAVGVDDLHAELDAARSSAPAPAPAPPVAPRSPIEDDDSIRRTLVLAQRTADLAIAEARTEADRLVEDARAESHRLVTEARDAAQRIANDAEIDLSQRVTRLTDQRDNLDRDVRTLTALVEGERSRLAESLGILLSQVTDLQLSEAFNAFSSVRRESPQAVSPPPFLTDDPARSEAAEAYGAESADLDLDLDLTIATPTERPVTIPTPVASPPADPASDDQGADEALWERWASSADVDETRADDPFRFGNSEE
jgi:DivIVA domain-containing protein